MSGYLDISGLSIPTDKVLGAWQEQDDVLIWWRDNGGGRRKARVKGCPWYFCATENDFNKIPMATWDKWKQAGLLTSVKLDSPYVYIYSKGSQWMKRDNRNRWLTEMDDLGCKPLEGDVGPPQRLLIDLNIGTDKNYQVAYWDLETDDRNGMIRIGKDRIISAAIIDGAGIPQTLVLQEDSDEGERALLEQIIGALDGYDIITGWNSSRFDYLVLMDRLRFHHISWWPKYIKFLDLLVLFRSWFVFERLQIRRWNLDFVASNFGIQGKLELPRVDGEGRTYRAWLHDQPALEEYNLQDVRIVKQLADTMETLRLLMEQCTISGLPVTWYTTGMVVDFMLLREAANRRAKGEFAARFPTSYYRPEHIASFKTESSDNDNDNVRKSQTTTATEARIARRRWQKDHGFEISPVKGPLVLDPILGISNDVWVVDFASMYPSTMITYNIGQDTIVDETFTGPTCVGPNGQLFRTDIPSVLSTVLQQMIDSRGKWKKIQHTTKSAEESKVAETVQLTLKAITNSCYGVMAQFGRRYYQRGVAEAITQSSQLYIHFGVDWFKKRGHPVIFGDTDSFAVAYPGTEAEIFQLADQFVTDLRSHVASVMRAPNPQALKLTVEKHFKRLLVLTKKVYAGHLVWQDEQEIDIMFVRGMRLLKRDTPGFAAKLEREMLDLLLMSEELPTAEVIRNWALTARTKLLLGDIDVQDMVIYKVVSKNPNDYKTYTAHAALAKRLMDEGVPFTPGSQIAYVVTDGSTGKMQVEAVQRVEQGISLDGRWYWDSFWSQAEDILKLVYPTEDWGSCEIARLKGVGGVQYPIQPRVVQVETDMSRG